VIGIGIAAAEGRTLFLDCRQFEGDLLSEEHFIILYPYHKRVLALFGYFTEVAP
jgi:hypothetical protein